MFAETLHPLFYIYLSPLQVLKNPATNGDTMNTEAVDVEAGLVHRRVLRSAYITHNCARPVSQVAFAPYEDVLGVGTGGGFHSLLCPGAGEPNFDALEENPFANPRYRQEREVRRLLNKVSILFLRHLCSLESNEWIATYIHIFVPFPLPTDYLVVAKPRVESVSLVTQLVISIIVVFS